LSSPGTRYGKAVGGLQVLVLLGLIVLLEELVVLLVVSIVEVVLLVVVLLVVVLVVVVSVVVVSVVVVLVLEGGADVKILELVVLIIVVREDANAVVVEVESRLLVGPLDELLANKPLLIVAVELALEVLEVLVLVVQEIGEGGVTPHWYIFNLAEAPQSSVGAPSQGVTQSDDKAKVLPHCNWFPQ
jgi:hypothetical protein